MLNPKIRDQAYQFFIEEAPELLEIIEHGLLNLKTNRSTNNVHELMRAAHSLKGGSASVGLESIKTISHHLEDIFKSFYKETVIIDDDLEELLLEAYDALKNPLMEQIKTNHHDEDTALANALPIIERIELLLGDNLNYGDQYLPSSSDLGIDIVQSIFEVDVGQGLKRLETLIKSPQNKKAISEALRSLAEVFSGFSVLFNLEGFGEICETVIQALDYYPEQYLIIAQIALEDWQLATNAVLAGDREHGGSPSVALRSLAINEVATPTLPQEDLNFILENDWQLEKETTLNEQVLLPENLPTFSLDEAFGNLLAEQSQELIEPTTPVSLEEMFGSSTPASLEEISEQTSNVSLEEMFGSSIPASLEEIPQTTTPVSLEEMFGSTNNTNLDELIEPTTPVSLEEMFGSSIPASLEEIPQTTTPVSLEEMFGSTTPASLEEMFGSTNNLDEISEQISNVSLEEIFGSTTPASLEEISEQTSNVSLEEMFGSSIPPSLEEIPQTTTPVSLEEMFGSSTPASLEEISEQTTTSVSLEEMFGSSTNTNLDEISEQTSNVSLEEIFGSTNNLDEINEQTSNVSLEEMFGSTTPASLEEMFGSTNNLDEISEQTSNVSLEEMFEQQETIEPVLDLPKVNLPAFPTLQQDFPTLQQNSINEQIRSEQSELNQPIPPENLEQVLESVQKIFTQLPEMPEVNALAEDTVSTKSAKVEKAREKNSQQVNPTLSIKVAFERLEKMSNLVGELSINRNSLSLQNEQIQATVNSLLNRFTRFQRMTGKLRDLSDKLILTPLKSLSSQVQNDSSLADFDVLEMDRYGLLYGLLQDILEEMLQLEESVDDVVLFARTSNQTLEQQRQMLQGLRDELMWARMLPLGEILGRFPRLLRDLSNKYNKPVQLQVTGNNVLVDRVALEKLYDPLVHLLRNAFDHGIEKAQQREELKKPPTGQIIIRAYHQGNQTIIEVQDDGRGLSLEKIGQQAIKAGLLTSEELTTIPKEHLSNLIFEPGFSTADQVTELSGRGVGLDVVRDQVRLLKGNVTVNSTPGQGTTFSLRLPLTMTIAKLLVCLVQNQQSAKNLAIAIPSDTIEEIIIPNPLQIKTSNDHKFLYWQENLIPIYPLQDYLNYNCLIPETFSSKAITPVPIPEEWCSPLLLIRQKQTVFALEVNRLLIEQELVIKPFGKAIASPSYSYGCTILGDGVLIPVINAALLIEQVLQSESETPIISSMPIPQLEVPAILVIDDSATIRRTLAFTLQKAGYRVIQAKDGKEALDQLQGGAQVQLIICDVEMPNMNGFEFLGQRRQDPKLTTIPVVMLTSRGSEKHRKLANYLGANSYFTKPFIEQQFLTEISKFLIPTSSINKAVSLTN